MVGRTGNLPPMPGIFPDYAAAILRNGPDGRELALARWGMPSPAFALQGKRTDPGVTNIRNTGSPHWRRWLSLENQCLVPFTSFSEHEVLPDERRPPVWFAFGEDRPLAFFAGIHVQGWISTCKLREGEVTTDLFGFLTTSPNAEVSAVYLAGLARLITVVPVGSMSWATSNAHPPKPHLKPLGAWRREHQGSPGRPLPGYVTQVAGACPS